MEYTEALRRLAINDLHFLDDGEMAVEVEVESMVLDPKTLSLVRVAALVAVGGAAPSYGAVVDQALSAGASAAEIVDVLAGVVAVVGIPSVVAAAPRVAQAIGYEIYDAE